MRKCGQAGSQATTKDVAQRSPSTLSRAVSLSNGKWTFYEVVL